MSTYNLESVKEMAAGDEDFVQVVVQTFVEEIPPDLKAMNEAIAAGNADVAYQYAHKMKPNFNMFGLELTSQIKKIEKWAKDKNSFKEVEMAAREITSKVVQAEKEIKEDYNLE